VIVEKMYKFEFNNLKLIYMNTKSLSFLLIATALVFQGCSGDEEDTTPEVAKTNTELISSAPWIITSATVSPGIEDEDGNIVTDLYSLGDPCALDDQDVYNADGTGNFNEGASKCDPDDPQVFGNFTWKFNATETELIITEDIEYSYGISELTATKLVTTETEDDGGGEIYTFTYTFSH
jgi:hypothetical protein